MAFISQIRVLMLLFIQSFFIHVAKPALPYCLATLQTDQSAIYKSLLAAAQALDPSEALI